VVVLGVETKVVVGTEVREGGKDRGNDGLRDRDRCRRRIEVEMGDRDRDRIG
jgi:hypothetical protein